MAKNHEFERLIMDIYTISKQILFEETLYGIPISKPSLRAILYYPNATPDLDDIDNKADEASGQPMVDFLNNRKDSPFMVVIHSHKEKRTYELFGEDYTSHTINASAVSILTRNGELKIRY